MVSEIAISPAGAKEDGCAASSEVINQESFPDTAADPDIVHSYWYKEYLFTAQAASGWEFSRWELKYNSVSGSLSNPESHDGDITSGSNPWGSRHTSATREYEEIETHSGQYAGEIEDWRRARTITALSAVFVRVPGVSGKILRSASSGAILHGASGAILHDA